MISNSKRAAAESRDAKIKRLYEIDKLTTSQIAERMGLGREWVARILRAHGVVVVRAFA